MSTASELDWQKGEVRKYEKDLAEAKRKVDELQRKLEDERHQQQGQH